MHCMNLNFEALLGKDEAVTTEMQDHPEITLECLSILQLQGCILWNLEDNIPGLATCVVGAKN